MNTKLKEYGWVIAAIVIGVTAYSGWKIPDGKPAIQPTVKADGAVAEITDAAGNRPQTEIETGENLVLSCGTSVFGKGQNAVKWVITPVERATKAMMLENNTILSLPVGRKPVGINVTLLVAKNDTVAFRSLDFKVVDPDHKPVVPVPEPIYNPPAPPQPLPKPPVDPVPTPKPDPVIPAPVPVDSLAKFKLALKDLPLPTGAQPKEIKAIAEAYKDIADAISNGTVKDAKEMMSDTSEQIQQRAGINVFLVWVEWRTKMITLLEQANVTEFKDHAKYWTAVAQVLEEKVGPP